MPTDEPPIHPYDILAHPKRKRILEALQEGKLTFTQLMARSAIDDSGKLSYHLGVLSRYIQHDKDLYTLSIEGRVLAGAVREFEEKSYGLMSTTTFSGIVDPSGRLKMAYSMRFSIMTPSGDLLRKNIEEYGFDKKKADAVLGSRLGGLGVGVEGVSVDINKRGLVISLEHEAQGFVERDGWMVGNPLDLFTAQKEGKEGTASVPGLHFQVRGSILYPEHAMVDHEKPNKKALEEKGVDVFELVDSGQNLRWRVKGGFTLCLGESRLETDGNRTREIVEMEIHALLKDPSQMPEIRGQMGDLPRLLSGRTRFRLPD